MTIINGSGDFRAALGSFATGVTIVTTRAADGKDVGMTANSFNSVSLDPPMVLWSIGKNALSQPAFATADHFAVHILASDQEELSNRFARRGEDKFAGLDLERGPGDIPLLGGCAARFKCRTAYRYEGGDHDIIVGEVLEFDHFEKKPLLFHRGKYSALAGVSGAEFADSSLGFLLARAQFAVFKDVRSELERLDISLDQYFALAALGAKSMSAQDIHRHGSFYDRSFGPADVEKLEERGLVEGETERLDADLKLTAAGRQTMVRLLAIGKDAEATLLAQFEPWEGQWLKSAMDRLASGMPEVPVD
ncbi:flavin reductase [Sphingomonas oligophenolica]|uniref:Flavin reductase n=2 Tax=Sphingomonas oligophenolica TaxID=301154 RepID=A0ABU9Y9X8_9SPHN